MSWMSQRDVLDEILPADGWPMLVIRTPGLQGPSWRLIALGPDGAADAGRLPITGRSKMSRLKGDARGDAWAFLVHVEGEPSEPPGEPPRLVILRRRTVESETALRQGATR